MKRLTKYSKRMKLRFIKSAGIISATMIIAFPWFSNFSNTNENYYTVVLNGINMGAVDSRESAEEAYLNARLKIENENDASVYIDYDLEVKKEKSLIGDKTGVSDLSKNMYKVLKKSSLEVKKQAYIVDIDGFTVTLSSKDEVLSLLNAAKDKYDEKDAFMPTLKDDGNQRLSDISYDMINLTKESNNNPVVMSSANSAVASTEATTEDGNIITDIGFAENIDIIETYVSSSQILPLSEAIDLVTKEKEESIVYVVVEGDTLSRIAESYNLTLDKLLELNPDFNEETSIQIGDRITVTIPEPELSVVVEKQETYEEEYNSDVQYEYNDSQYTTYSKVISEGSVGKRKVTAKVTYINGKESSRTILVEDVIAVSTPKVVEVGTITPPTFIKPISGGSFSSGFGARWGTFHYGVDWSCSTGTSVMASSGGTVVSAGWSGGYGYCIVIDHGNGMQTKYAHLSSIKTSYGKTVKQGQVIGLSGNTGDSTGPHLHFEIIDGGTKVNPLKYLN